MSDTGEDVPPLSEALMEPWGPFEMGGLEGCTDRNPDYCACATDTQPTCRICDQEIEPGEMAWARQWPCYDTLPLDHRDQEWDVISWHDECPNSRVLPPDDWERPVEEPVTFRQATDGAHTRVCPPGKQADQ